MPSRWVRWSCPYCDQGIGLRANSKAQPWHHCPRKMGKWLPLTKETNDQTNPGRCDPASGSAGGDARAKRSVQPSGSRITSITDHGDYVSYGFTLDVLAGTVPANPRPYDVYDFGPAFYDDYHGSDLYRRGTIARAGGWRDFAHFLEWCGEIAS